jgi:hypothetical protein
MRWAEQAGAVGNRSSFRSLDRSGIDGKRRGLARMNLPERALAKPEHPEQLLAYDLDQRFSGQLSAELAIGKSSKFLLPGR